MTKFYSLIDFQKKFDTDDKCRAFLRQRRWKDGKPVCPYCNCQKAYELKDGKRFTCSNKTCKRVFSVTVGTIYENTKIPLTKWFLAMYVVENHSKGISSLQLAGYIGTTQRTAWFVLHRIREMVRDKENQLLKNIVELDESYVGGKNKNRHKHKRVKHSQGRSLKDKTAIFGMMERGGKLHVLKVKNTQAKTLKPIIKEMIAKGSILMTDEWTAYAGISRENYIHGVVKHNEGQYVQGSIHTNSIEGFWSLFKRCIYGIYHNVSPKHMDMYCAEISYRYNQRKRSQFDRFESAMTKCNTRLTYNQLIAN